MTHTPNRESVDCRLDEPGMIKNPGDFFYDDEDGIFISIPGSGIRHIPFHKPNSANGRWQWDGNREKPTLSPSILISANPISQN